MVLRFRISTTTAGLECFQVLPNQQFGWNHILVKVQCRKIINPTLILYYILKKKYNDFENIFESQFIPRPKGTGLSCSTFCKTPEASQILYNLS